MNNPIAAAVEPRRQASVDHALEHARAAVEVAYATLTAAGWDVNKVAPRAKGTMSRPQYVQAQSLRRFYDTITRATARHITNEPKAWERDPEGVARFLEQVAADAGAQFDAYVAKLTAKVGEAVYAEIDGAHLWHDSVLTVNKPDGSVERWNTKQIVNVSCLGKLFNQWPTRKVK